MGDVVNIRPSGTAMNVKRSSGIILARAWQGGSSIHSSANHYIYISQKFRLGETSKIVGYVTVSPGNPTGNNNGGHAGVRIYIKRRSSNSEKDIGAWGQTSQSSSITTNFEVSLAPYILSSTKHDIEYIRIDTYTTGMGVAGWHSFSASSNVTIFGVSETLPMCNPNSTLHSYV